MSPSRGFNIFIRARILPLRQNARSVSTRANSWFVEKVAAISPQAKHQIFISRTNDPYLNLSIEHYLLQNTHADSTILFLYINRPSIVIGRNQNPWVEVNLGLAKSSQLDKIDIVRRRSGGGTVFHDEGNVNYSVICPTAQFHRDKHAEMVVRALKKLDVKMVRVNERHDIVMDPDPASKEKIGGMDDVTRKISGSAYKLTRLRSLHHGTCLLQCRHLGSIGELLRSPAKQYIEARGVESVPSPIRNVTTVGPEAFIKAVTTEFQEMYQQTEPFYVGEKVRYVPEIRDGKEELKSKGWIYGQTPQFTFDINRAYPEAAQAQSFSASFTARYMKLSDFKFSLSGPGIPDDIAPRITKTINASPMYLSGIDWTEKFLVHAMLSESLNSHAQESRDEDKSQSASTVPAVLKFAGDALNSIFGKRAPLGDPKQISSENNNGSQTPKSWQTLPSQMRREAQKEKMKNSIDAMDRIDRRLNKHKRGLTTVSRKMNKLESGNEFPNMERKSLELRATELSRIMDGLKQQMALQKQKYRKDKATFKRNEKSGWIEESFKGSANVAGRGTLRSQEIKHRLPLDSQFPTNASEIEKNAAAADRARTQQAAEANGPELGTQAKAKVDDDERATGTRKEQITTSHSPSPPLSPEQKTSAKSREQAVTLHGPRSPNTHASRKNELVTESLDPKIRRLAPLEPSDLDPAQTSTYADTLWAEWRRTHPKPSSKDIEGRAKRRAAKLEVYRKIRDHKERLFQENIRTPRGKFSRNKLSAAYTEEIRRALVESEARSLSTDQVTTTDSQARREEDKQR